MSDHGYSMPCYFQNMPVVGAPLRAVNAENEAELKKIAVRTNPSTLPAR